MKIWLSTLLMLMLGSVVPVWGEGSFVDGEELVYAVKWTGVPAGEIALSTHRLAEGRWQFELQAKTNSFWSMVYKVHDVISTEIQEAPFRSLKFSKDASQGRRHIVEKIEIKYDENKIALSKQNISAREKASLSEIEMASDIDAVQDPLSMIYLLRTLKFSHVEELEKSFSVFASKEIYSINFKLIDESVLDSSIFGKRRVWNLAPSAEYEGSLVSKGKLELCVDCETGIPLRMTFHIPVGWATLELKSSNNPELKSTSFRDRRRR